MERTAMFFSLLVFLLVLLPSSAASVDVRVSERKACMVAPHTFDINVTNTQERKDTFYVKTKGKYSKWTWVSNKLMQLSAGESEPTEVYVLPPKMVDMGKYTFNVSAFSTTNNSVQINRELCFIVFRNHSMKIENFTISEGEYAPEETVEMSVSSLNTGSKDFENVTFVAEIKRNDEVLMKSPKSFKLETEEREVATLDFQLDKYQDPGGYDVEYRVVAKGRNFGAGVGSFDVSEVTNKTVSETSEAGPLTLTKEITVSNVGNSVLQDKVTREISYPYAFLVTSKTADVESSGLVAKYSWDIQIDPGESQTLQYKVNLWPVYILLILIAVVLYRLYLYLQVPVISKEVRQSEVSEDKRIFTISLEVKNRLIGKAKNVVVEDSIPPVARVIEKFDTMEPTIDKDGDETKLRWKIGEIDPGDDRILHYKIKALVESVDYLKLPRATLRGIVKDREFEKKSSGVRVEV